MTILLGPAPCHSCRAPVTVVKRTAEVPCNGLCPNLVMTEYPPFACEHRHTHAIPDVALAVVDADGSTHICPLAEAS